jgi:hypothetical protein
LLRRREPAGIRQAEGRKAGRASARGYDYPGRLSVRAFAGIAVGLAEKDVTVKRLLMILAELAVALLIAWALFRLVVR